MQVIKALPENGFFLNAGPSVPPNSANGEDQMLLQQIPRDQIFFFFWPYTFKFCFSKSFQNKQVIGAWKYFHYSDTIAVISCCVSSFVVCFGGSIRRKAWQVILVHKRKNVHKSNEKFISIPLYDRHSCAFIYILYMINSTSRRRTFRRINFQKMFSINKIIKIFM